MSRQPLNRWNLALAVTLMLTGCGGGSGKGPQTVNATGVVNYNGRPVPKLTVTFTPQQTGMAATGTTDEMGKFSLMTSKPNDGAMPGTYDVTISFMPDEAPPMPGFPGSEKKIESPIPKKYADPTKSKLKQTVESDPTKNNFTFDLTD